MVVMLVCYSLMGRELWGSKSIGEHSQRQTESVKSKKKVSSSDIFMQNMPSRLLSLFFIAEFDALHYYSFELNCRCFSLARFPYCHSQLFWFFFYFGLALNFFFAWLNRSSLGEHLFRLLWGVFRMYGNYSCIRRELPTNNELWDDFSSYCIFNRIVVLQLRAIGKSKQTKTFNIIWIFLIGFIRDNQPVSHHNSTIWLCHMPYGAQSRSTSICRCVFITNIHKYLVYRMLSFTVFELNYGEINPTHSLGLCENGMFSSHFIHVSAQMLGILDIQKTSSSIFNFRQPPLKFSIRIVQSIGKHNLLTFEFCMT